MSCRRCGAHLCAACAIEGRCPSCTRTVRSKRRRLWAVLAWVAVGALGPASLAIPVASFLRRPSCVGARHELASVQLENLRTALVAYVLSEGKPPETLAALYTRGFVSSSTLVDPWGRPFDYRCVAQDRPGERLEDGGREWDTTVRSAGPDGVLETEDDIIGPERGELY